MLTGKETILSISENYSECITEFENAGLGNYFKPENLKNIGKYISVSTILGKSGIDVEMFVGMLNKRIASESAQTTSIKDRLHFIAMLPCGLQNPFKEMVERYIADTENGLSGLNYLIEGNVNHELSYYPLLDAITDRDEIPDIIIASDVNNFFHKPFVERFINKGVFKAYYPYEPNDYLKENNYIDPKGIYTMLTANMLVMAVDKSRLGNREMPRQWSDLLQPEFAGDVIIRGEKSFFCNAVMLPLFKDSGLAAIKDFARNIKSGRHPSEMVKLADAGKEESASVYVMPYFFSKNIKNNSVEVIFPKDGAIISPVFMLVKADVIEKYKSLLDFLVSKEIGQLFAKRLFPSVHPDVDNSMFPSPIKWLGWDFLSNNDIGRVKDEIQMVLITERNLK